MNALFWIISYSKINHDFIRKFYKNLIMTFSVWITANYGKFWKRWEYQTTLPTSWETCLWVKKQQLELDMEQQTWNNS